MKNKIKSWVIKFLKKQANKKIFQFKIIFFLLLGVIIVMGYENYIQNPLINKFGNNIWYPSVILELIGLIFLENLCSNI